MEYISIDSEFIKLDQFLKFVDIAMSGGEAKFIIECEEIKVNGEVETRRGKKLRSGDIISYQDREMKIK